MAFGSGQREELLEFGVGGEGVGCQVACGRNRLGSLGGEQFLDRQPRRRPDEGLPIMSRGARAATQSHFRGDISPWECDAKSHILSEFRRLEGWSVRIGGVTPG